MVVEMLLLVLIAAGVFAFVLTPIVRPAKPVAAPEEMSENEPVDEREPVTADGQPVRDPL